MPWAKYPSESRFSGRVVRSAKDCCRKFNCTRLLFEVWAPRGFPKSGGAKVGVLKVKLGTASGFPRGTRGCWVSSPSLELPALGSEIWGILGFRAGAGFGLVWELAVSSGGDVESS